MPVKFAITCPGCAARVLSKTERPIGKGVQCPKCGEQFYLTAENQEVVKPTAAPRADDDRPARRRRAEDECDDQRTRRRPRDNDGRDDDEAPHRRQGDDESRPERKSGRRKAVLVLAAASALGLFLICGGVGAYFLFFRGGSAADKVRPPRGLRDDMFAYVPETANRVEFEDHDVIRETGGSPDQNRLDFVLPHGATIPVATVRARCTSRGNPMTSAEVTLLHLNVPDTSSQVATRCKLQRAAGTAKEVYTGKEGFTEWALFSPEPDKLVFVKSAAAKPLDQELLKALLSRDPGSSNLTPFLREGLTSVSGYPMISGSDTRNEPGPGPRAGFSGTITTSGVREHYSFQQFASAAKAKEWFNLPVPEFKGPTQMGFLEKSDWLSGDKIYHLRRTKVSD